MRDGRPHTDPAAFHASGRDDESGRPSKTRGALIAGRYVVDRMLGRGGMATVYLAHDRLVDRPVALKVLRRDLANSVAMERFTREIGVIGRLRHAHIVPLHDSGVYDELPFYVMAYVEGESLQDRVAREGALPIADVARVGEQVAEALAYAHREGVLHRDITPGNILLADGNAYVADFGIARLFTEPARPRTTETGYILGTPTYMSPEQASGEMECDGRSDIYSLGCVLYEAATGTPPFRGPTPQAIIAGRFGPPPPPVIALRGDVPPELSDAIARAMMTDPPDRFQTATEFGAAIESAAPPDPARARLRIHRGRLRRLAVMVALVASAFLGAMYLAGARWGPLRAQLDRIALNRAIGLVAQGEWARADTALRDAVARDPANALAHLWLAQNGALAATTALEPSGEWKAEVSLAEEGRATLDSVSRLRLDALNAYAQGAYDVARDRYHRLIVVDPAHVATRLALADAYLNDNLVEPDSSSPSRWRFRASFQQAALALQQAHDLRPKAPPIRRAAYERLTRVLISSSRYRAGRASAGPVRAFAGFPSLDADTLAFVPYPLAEVASGVAESRNTTPSDALDRNRRTLTRVAAAWVADLPEDADAHRAYATALAATGVLTSRRPEVANAIGEIRRARELARDARSQLLMGAQEVRLLARARRLGDARRLADSLVSGAEPRALDEILALAALATLTGNVQRAVAFMALSASGGQVQLIDGRDFTLPPTLPIPWSALGVYSALGKPTDSILALRSRVDALVQRDVAPMLMPIVRTSLLRRLLRLAAPAVGPHILVETEPGDGLMGRLMRDVAAHDTASLRAGLRGVDSLRRFRDAASLSIDGAYLYSWLRLVAGDTAGAERQMDTVLEQLRPLTDGPPTDMIGSALVVRLMRQRAEVAERRGQPAVARLWRAAVDTLWGESPSPTPRR